MEEGLEQLEVARGVVVETLIDDVLRLNVFDAHHVEQHLGAFVFIGYQSDEKVMLPSLIYINIQLRHYT